MLESANNKFRHGFLTNRIATICNNLPSNVVYAKTYILSKSTYINKIFTFSHFLKKFLFYKKLLKPSLSYKTLLNLLKTNLIKNKI